MDFAKLLAEQRARQAKQAEKPTDMLESDIEQKVHDYAALKGLWHAKFKSANQRSVPDRVFASAWTGVFWIEFKRYGKEPTDAQASKIKQMRAADCLVFVVDSVAMGKRIIDELTDF